MEKFLPAFSGVLLQEIQLRFLVGEERQQAQGLSKASNALWLNLDGKRSKKIEQHNPIHMRQIILPTLILLVMAGCNQQKKNTNSGLTYNERGVPQYN